MTDGVLLDLRIFPRVVAYEMRKALAFRLGFLLREGLHGVARAVVTLVVFGAMFRSSGAADFRGYSYQDLVAYLVWSTALHKCLTDERSFDLSEQIFDGYITKFLVMPIHPLMLAWGRGVQIMLVQLMSVTVLWTVGALVLPLVWPYPVSALALVQALVLLFLGAGCFILAFIALNLLAFWLDVVWALLNMFKFVSFFVGGGMVPIALMPDAVQTVLGYTFAYWTVFGPTELLLGRMGSVEFARGVLVLMVWLCVLQGLVSLTWQRGIRRYSGVGA